MWRQSQAAMNGISRLCMQALYNTSLPDQGPRAAVHFAPLERKPGKCAARGVDDAAVVFGAVLVDAVAHRPVVHMMRPAAPAPR